MANWYCDHGCALYPTVYMSAPASAASLPQEGDGKASGTGAAPAVASATMDFTGVTAAAGAAFAVHGASMACVASGASTVQFNAGSGSALAANLATAINAATASPTTTTGNISSPYLKGLVWAVASGAVLTVYTRIASADLNQSVNASATLVCGTLGSWTSAPATANFTGGVSGPWAMMLNGTALTAAVSATVSAIGTYGAWPRTMMGNYTTGADVLHVRTGRAGADITLDITGVMASTGPRVAGAVGSYFETRFDNGVIWSDGNSNGVFTLRKAVAVGTAILLLSTTGGFYRYRGQMKSGTDVQSGGTCNFRIRNEGTVTPYSTSVQFRGQGGTGGASSNILVEGLELSDGCTGSSLGFLVLAFAGAGPAPSAATPRFVNCKFGHMTSATKPWLVAETVYGGHVEAADCLFAYGNLTFAKALLDMSGTLAHSIRLVRPKITGGNGGHHTLIPFPVAGYASCVLMIEDPIDLGQFIPSDSASSCLGAAGWAAGQQGCNDMSMGQFISSNSVDRTFLIDTPRRLLEWRQASFPTTGLSKLPGDISYSIRFSAAPTSVPGFVTEHNPVKGIKQTVNTALGDATLTLTNRFLLDASFGGATYTPTGDEFWIEGTYVSSVDGLTKVFSTKGTAPASDVATAWSATTYSPFAGASRSYSKWKCTATLTSVKNNTEVTCYLVCAKASSSLNEWCFQDPQFGLST